MQAEAGRWLAAPVEEPDAEGPDADDPVARLRSLLTHTARIGLRYPHLLEIAVRYDLEQGDFAAAHTVVPLLRELWEGKRSESEIRLAALQLLVSIQALYLRRDETARFTGFRLVDADDMEQLVNRLIDNMLCLHKSGAGSGAESEDVR